MVHTLPSSFLFPIIIYNWKFIYCNLTVHQEKGGIQKEAHI